jgi:hypothetical protein
MDNLGLMSLLGANLGLGIEPAIRGGVPSVGLNQGGSYFPPNVGMQYSMPPVSRLGALMGSPYGYEQGAMGMLNQLLQKQFDDKMKANEDVLIDYLLQERARQMRESEVTYPLSGM